MPGEVSQEAGRAYAYVLGGCLERAIDRFRQIYNVYLHPEKLTFTGFAGSQYSFDLSGELDGAEVFVESKGYRDSSGLLEAYREFVARAYCTSVQFARHKSDYFWFVTNVPFGSSFGRSLVSTGFISDALRTAKTPKSTEMLAGATIDDDHIRSLSERLAVGIFTDSFIRTMGTMYRFRYGDSLWSVTKLIHAGRIPRPHFEPIAIQTCQMNDGLEDPNRIRSGRCLRLPWYGLCDEDLVPSA